VQKSYYYINSTSLADTASAASSGVLGGQTQYYFDNYRVWAYNAPTRWLYVKSVFSTQSVLPGCNNSHGSHIGYSQVLEKNADGSYKVYNFTNFDNGRVDEVALPQNILQEARIPYEPYSSNEEQRGKLFRERSYNSAGQVVKLHEVDYVKVADGFVRAIKATAYLACGHLADARIGEGTAYRLYTYSYVPSQERETVYDLQGLNGSTVIKTYLRDGSHPKLLASESVQDSKGSTLTTRYKYPLDFPYGGSVSSTPEVRALVQMPSKNMIGIPIETVRYRNGLVVDATLNSFRFNGNSIVSNAVARLESTQPLAVGQYTNAYFNNSAGTGSPSPFIIDGKLRPKATVISYDNKSNVLGLSRESTGPVSYLWGYNSSYLIAKAENAAPNEIYHNNFEDRNGWDTNLSYDGVVPFRSGWLYGERVFTGEVSGIINNFSQGYNKDSFSTTPLTVSLTAPKKFIFSGWVYSQGPNAQLWLQMYRPNEIGYGSSYVDYVDTREVNKWVYLEKVVEVPADVTSINFRLTNFYRGSSPAGGNVWFDDLRIHPADAQMTTYTYGPMHEGLSSMSDSNNKPVRYEYDGLNRLFIVRDHDGNIVKQLDYHYQR
jgi:hypothetical protein